MANQTQDQNVISILTHTPNHVLLATYAALTHQIHAAIPKTPSRQEKVAQRDIVEAEILRRMEGSL